MFTNKKNLFPLLAAGISFIALTLAVFAESVDKAATFDFTEFVSMADFTSSIGLIRAEHLQMTLPDFLAFVGIVALFVSSLKGYFLPTYLWITYFLILLFSYGSYGVVTLLFLPLYGRIDGEFFQDGMPRLIAYGVWMLSLAASLFWRFRRRDRIDAEQAAVS